MAALPLNQVLLGDCLEVLKTLPDTSIDAVVTDPPYGLGTKEPSGPEIQAYLDGADLDHGGDFMGRNWSIPSVAVWRECLRVLKPGGHLLSFGGTRTFDLISVGIRTAGFENRDTVASFFCSEVLAWIQGQGFPKSQNIQKAMLKAGVDPEIANQWAGYGTALKPSWEPILVFRKPLEEPTVTAQILATGTGGINVDACRISSNGEEYSKNFAGSGFTGIYGYEETGRKSNPYGQGRWPANILLVHSEGCRVVGTKKVQAPVINRFDDGMKPFGEGAGHSYTSTQTGDADGMEEIPVYECEDGCPVKLLDEQSGNRPSTGPYPSDARSQSMYRSEQGNYQTQGPLYSDTGGASSFFGQIQPDAPFFYTGKVSRSERNKGLVPQNFRTGFVVLRDDISDEASEKIYAEWPENLPSPELGLERDRVPEKWLHYFDDVTPGMNSHPTVKPLALMEWLVKLVTPKGGTVLDPYCGSGTTCIAALAAGCNYIGIEKDPVFHEVAVKRIAALLPEIKQRAEHRSQQELFNLMDELPQDD